MKHAKLILTDKKNKKLNTRIVGTSGTHSKNDLS